MQTDLGVFDSLLEPCIVINRHLQVVYCNETAGILFGVSNRKIVRSKMKIEDLLEFNQEVEGFKQIKKLDSATPVEEISAISKASGITSKLQLTVQPLQAGDDPEGRWLVFVRDVTLEERLQNKYKGELGQKEKVISDLKESKKIIEDYSLNLENKVTERTRELSALNQTLTALIDSLNQGFFIFDNQGICLPIYSKACEAILEDIPVGRHFADILNLEGEEKIKVNEWIEFLFEQKLPFEESVHFGPQSRVHSLQKNIELAYCAIFGENQKLINVVVIASDTTSLLEARNEAEYEKNQAKLIMNILRNRKQIHNFCEDCRKIINNLRSDLKKNIQSRNCSEIFRGLHTLKGGSGSIGLVQLAEYCHQAENILSQIKSTSVDTLENNKLWQDFELIADKIEDDFVSFVDYTIQLIGKSLSSERILEISYSKFVTTLNRTSPVLINQEIKDFLIDEFVLESVVDYVKGYQSSIDKLAEELGKKILPLEIQNGQIKIFADHYKNLFNSLIHVFRNAIDHGIEFPDRRESNGKGAAGKISIEFAQQDEILKITIKDDGGGINPQNIRTKLLKNGIDVSLESDEEVIQHIFDAEFSTKQEVTSISGRGVGMDAVMQAARELGGSACVFSQVNVGTIFVITVPYLKKINRDFSPKI